jgi:glutathione S-transferase
MMKIELISFKICPFVQRSVILLLEKDIPYDITYIDINNPPAWFTDISPFAKVPVLRINDTVLFESAVINEYLDEVTPPSLHPQDPLEKAQHRGWIEYGSSLNFEQHDLYWSKDQQDYQRNLENISKKLQRLEQQLTNTPFFGGNKLSLVDIAYAPLLMRFKLIEKIHPSGLFEGLPRMQAWSVQLTSLDSVQKSVVPEFDDLYVGAIKKSSGYMSAFLT